MEIFLEVKLNTAVPPAVKLNVAVPPGGKAIFAYASLMAIFLLRQVKLNPTILASTDISERFTSIVTAE